MIPQEMTPQQIERITAVIRRIHADWHGCARVKPSKNKASIQIQLCDVCEEAAKTDIDLCTDPKEFHAAQELLTITPSRKKFHAIVQHSGCPKSFLDDPEKFWPDEHVRPW